MRSLILYGPYNLSQDKVSISSGDLRGTPTHNLERNSVARRDGAVGLNVNYDEREFSFRGRVKKPSGHMPEFEKILNEFKNAMSVSNRYLRVTRNWRLISDMNSTSNWSLSNDGRGLEIDNYTYMFGSSALKFNIDISRSTRNNVIITNTSLGSIDLEAYEEQGNFEFWVYIPNSQNINTLDFKIGSDSDNYYYTNTISTSYEGGKLKNGWNYISVDWSAMDGWYGSPDASSIDWTEITLSYSSNQVDEGGIIIDGLLWVDESKTINYPNTTVVDLKMGEEAGYTAWQPFTMDLVSIIGTGRDTHTKVASELRSESDMVNNFEAYFEGTYNPTPAIDITLNNVVDIESLTYTNENSEESLTVSTTFEDEDRILINTNNLSVTYNGNAIDYTGVFPRHVIGNNNIRLNLVSSTQDSIEQTDYNSVYILPNGNALTQTFTAPATGVLQSVEINIKPNNELGSSYLWLKIYDDDGGSPNEVVASKVVSYEGETSYQWSEFTFSLDVTNGDTYYLAFYHSKVDTTHNIRYNSGSDSYANGQLYLDDFYYYDDDLDDLEVVGTSADLAFKLYLEPTPVGGSNDYDADINYFKRYV